MKAINAVFLANGFKITDYNSSIFDSVFEKENMVFVVKEFKTRDEVDDWPRIQEEINIKIYLKVDNDKKLNIYLVLLIEFDNTPQDLFVFQRIEKDAFYCRKIVIRENKLDKDLQKLPFLPIEQDSKETVEQYRTKTIHEFLAGIVDSDKELSLAEKIFDLVEEKKIADKIIEFHQENK
ncbi:MAG: ABC-three component system middle component 1 [archaeon]